MAASVRPVIIKKKKVVGHGGSHGGAWKVAYADFVTAMMAFFLVMWILGLSESARKSIAGYFREPGIFSFTTGKALPEKIEVTRSEHSGDGSGATGTSDRDLIMRAGCTTDEPSKKQTAELNALQGEVQKELEALSKTHAELATVLKSVELKMTSEGLRIELAESKDIAFFDVSSARPNKTARDVLTAIAPALVRVGNPLSVEGHTDTRTYPKGAAYTNWELSSDRANAARKLLLDAGVPQEQISGVTGYADVRLRTPENPFDVSNRRVSLIVRYAGKKQP